MHGGDVASGSAGKRVKQTDATLGCCAGLLPPAVRTCRIHAGHPSLFLADQIDVWGGSVFVGVGNGLQYRAMKIVLHDKAMKAVRRNAARPKTRPVGLDYRVHPCNTFTGGDITVEPAHEGSVVDDAGLRFEVYIKTPGDNPRQVSGRVGCAC